MVKLKSKRLFIMLILLLGIASVLSGCSSSDASTVSQEMGELDPENPTKITFYSYSLAAPTMKEGMEHLINEFNDTIGKEKGVIVEGVADASYQQFKADIAAGKAVDIVQHTFSTLDNSRETLGFQAYEDVFPAEELNNHFNGISDNALSLGKIDGKTYGLAFTFSTPIVFMNGKLFEEAGLDPTKPPQTWEEVKEYSLKINEATGKDGFALAPDNGWTTEGVILSNGGKVLSDDRKEAQFANQESIEAIEMWKDLYQNGAHAVGSDTELPEQFMAGNLGMYITSTALHSGFKNASEAGGWELYGAGLPSFGNNPSVPVNSGSVLAVRPDNDVKKAAVWEFIKYVTGNEGYTIITSEVGYLPLRTELADDPNYLKGFIDENPLYKINLEQLKNIQPAVIWPAEYATEMSNIFRDAIVQSVSTDADVEKTLKVAEEEINQLIQ
ncbi:ABC transporter substrate-binding protein [Cytobacillus sp. OWB-43]|uniref:ABC transporter substrate-binding protein n=1 Tax=Cytobacillus sp. OWB-43 TaxID=3108468 RepID=UPI002AFE9A16|nr:ABC transporter substrate-binding protein [Cytobacillus sp. OWB-43]MEA1853421.1 ABC transporter substrate-binding protein [Cytobacillus sp. OWB-43]